MEISKHVATERNVGKVLAYQEDDGTERYGTITGMNSDGGYRVEWHDSNLVTNWNPLRSACAVY
jgi:hypothetical protein